METAFFVWLGIGAAVLFGVGVLVGLLLGRARQRAAQRGAASLEAALQQSQQELRQYRTHVTQHFTQTADLLQTLTADYRAVYEHLAAGAEALCAGQVSALSPEALRERLLAAPSEEGVQTTASVPSQASPLPAGEGQSSVDESHTLEPDATPGPAHLGVEDTPVGSTTTDPSSRR
jgi:uncharacterized membrane-anchored protein YhcB (DUF1043 family)